MLELREFRMLCLLKEKKKEEKVGRLFEVMLNRLANGWGNELFLGVTNSLKAFI